MSALAFQLEPALEASEPPEVRGLARDQVRLMVASRSGADLVHTRFHELPEHLRPGDLLVINNSATLPAAIPATRAHGAEIEVRFSTPAPPGSAGARRRIGAKRGAGADLFVVELRSRDGESPLGTGRAGERLALAGGARLELLVRYAGSRRLWLARADMDQHLHPYLARHGRPIRYRYVAQRSALGDYQNVYASVPGSAEMPSAGRPFTLELLARLAARGTLIAPLTLHTGVSSLEGHEAPYPEPYEVPEATAAAVNAVRGWGGRVIAVGTTVVRALETVAATHGSVRAGAGWTDIVVGAQRPPRVVDGIITGWHEPLASHLQMLEAIAGEALIRRCYASALTHGYLWHEFGDSHLILP